MREKVIKRFLKSKGKVVRPNSTIIRNLKFNFELKQLQKMNYSVFKRIERKGFFDYKLTPNNRKRRIAIIDGEPVMENILL